jgi:hypothetical protein
MRQLVGYAMNYPRALSGMRSRQLASQQPPTQRESVRTITINTDNLRALFQARYFLAGVLIGAVILLAVFLVME